MSDDAPHGSSDLADARRDVSDLRRTLQEGVTVETRATSIDGRSFEFVSPLDDPAPLGGYVVIDCRDGRRYVGQVTRREIASQAGARVTVDVPEVSFGVARVSQAELQLEARMTAGGGQLLGKMADGELAPTTHEDVFDLADMAPASADVVESCLTSALGGDAALDVGWSPFGGPEVRTTLRAAGFNRHTFLCGQSGSGKTFSLGVILERLLAETSLRMVILDPNSDYVGLSQLRPRRSFEKTVSSQSVLDGYDSAAAVYRDAAAKVKVLRNGDDVSPLRIFFSELTPHEQAAVLKLDPLRDSGEFRAYRRIAESMGERSYSLHDVRDSSLSTLQEEARAIGLRIHNLGVADWDVWADSGESSSTDQMSPAVRAFVLDIGGLDSQDEQSVIAMSLLGRMWRRREERQPMLVVIDEAHNICPAEPTSDLQALATDHVVRIAAEGRKFGIYLLLSTQRPQKLHPNVLSQCDNLVLMRMNSATDIDHLASTFSFVPRDLLEQSTGFKLGEALLAGKISPVPTLAIIEGRYSPEGGGDVAATWAQRTA